MNIISNIRPGIMGLISGKLHGALMEIDATDFSIEKTVVPKLLKGVGLPTDDEFINDGFEAYKQYMAIALIDSKNMHAVSDVVDPFWHAHILCTQKYNKFCFDVFGRFLHHHPIETEIERDQVEVLYDYTRRIYDKVFLHFEPWTFKPLTRDQLICFHNCDRYDAPTEESTGIFSIDYTLPRMACAA